VADRYSMGPCPPTSVTSDGWLYDVLVPSLGEGMHIAEGLENRKCILRISTGASCTLNCQYDCLLGTPSMGKFCAVPGGVATTLGKKSGSKFGDGNL